MRSELMKRAKLEALKELKCQMRKKMGSMEEDEDEEEMSNLEPSDKSGKETMDRSLALLGKDMAPIAKRAMMEDDEEMEDGEDEFADDEEELSEAEQFAKERKDFMQRGNFGSGPKGKKSKLMSIAIKVGPTAPIKKSKG